MNTRNRQLTVLKGLESKVGEQIFNEQRRLYFNTPIPVAYLDQSEYDYQKLFDKSYVPWLINRCKTLLKDIKLFKDTFEEDFKWAKSFQDKIQEDVFDCRKRVLKRANELNSDLLREQRKQRKGNNPTTKNAKTRRENRVNEQLSKEFGLDHGTIIDLRKSERTARRKLKSIYHKILNRTIKEVKHDKDPYGNKRREQLKKIATKKFYGARKRYRDDLLSKMGDRDYQTYEEIRDIVPKIGRVTTKPNKIKPVPHHDYTPYDPRVDDQYFDDDHISLQKLIDECVATYDGDIENTRERLYRVWGALPDHVDKELKHRIDYEYGNDNDNLKKSLIIVSTELNRYSNDIDTAAKSIMERLYEARLPITKEVKKSFYDLTGRNLEDFRGW